MRENMIAPKSPRSSAGMAVLTLVGVVAILYFAQDVLVPMALAIMLAFILMPLVERAQMLGANRPVAVAATTVIAFTLIGALVFGVASQFLGLVEELPSYRGNLVAKIKSAAGAGNSRLEQGVAVVQDLGEELQGLSPGLNSAPRIAKVQIVPPLPTVAQVVRSLLGPLQGPLTTGAIVVVFVIFILLNRDDLRDRLMRLLGASQMPLTVLALGDAAQRISRYLLMQTLVNGIQGTLVAAGLYLIGVPESLLWGALTIALRFIPYLGPMLAAIGPIALAVAYFDDWTRPLLVMGLIGTLELVSNNLLEPRLYGSSVGVSSFALIIAAVLWTSLWGVAGLFLATPLTVCLVVLGRHIPQLGFIEILFGAGPVLEPSERFYQRLLANDVDDAQDLLDDALRTGTLAQVCDAIVLPALRFTEQDHHRGAIDALRRASLLEHIAALIDELPVVVPALATAGTQTAEVSNSPVVRLSVLCLPAADRADELAARLTARLLAAPEFSAEVVAVHTLKGEMLERVAQGQPDVICISATPPSTAIHARYLCKKLRSRFGGVPIVVALWDARGDLQKATDRLIAAGASTVVTQAAAVLEEMTRLRQPLLQGVRRVLIDKMSGDGLGAAQQDRPSKEAVGDAST